MTTAIQRLQHFFTPSSYNLHIDVTGREQRRFSGRVTIAGVLADASTHIALHSKDLQINQATIDGQAATITTQTKNDLLTLTAATELSAGKHELVIDFSGTITDPMNGLYPCYFKLDGKAEELLATQFESHHAREVFPCIDEPGAKATFDVTLTTEPDITVIGNTPIKQQHTVENTLVTTFQTTPVMSTYLLAWVAGKLGYTEAKTRSGVTVRAYATPDKAAKTQFSLDIAVKTLDFFNEYFAIPYPLPKCDMVALPDFSSGAMENWGCITYRESSFLVDQHTAIGVRQYVAETVAHELAHQWFGNLVTMQWWDNLWLNESFASWAAYLACDHIFPEWQRWVQFFNDETAVALDRDSLATVQKVQQPVQNPHEIGTLFDSAIVYSKGASILHMLHAYVGPESFREGLRIYLKRHQYANTTEKDLWAAWSEASGKDIGAFMQPWISQPGHPMVTVGVDGQQAVLHQHRFYNNPAHAREHDATVWPIPLLSGGALPHELLDQPAASLQVNKTDQPLLLNQGRTGFYVTVYNADHLGVLAEEVRTGRLPVLDRLGLLNEAYDLARSGQQPTLQMLKLLEAYHDESSEPVWGAIASAVGALKMFINEDEALKPYLQQFVAELARRQYDRLGWEPAHNEPYFDTLLRPSVLGLMCYAEDKSAIQQALARFNAATRPEDIFGDIRGLVLSVAGKFGDALAFKQLLLWYKDQPSAELRVQLTAGLSSTRDQKQITQLLAMLTTKDVKLQDLFYWFVYLIRSHHARPATWQWVKDNWHWIEQNFGSDMHYSDFPRYSAGAFSTTDELAWYKQFFEPQLKDARLAREIKQGIEAIESKLLWRDRDLEAVVEYLRSRTAQANSVTTTPIV